MVALQSKNECPQTNFSYFASIEMFCVLCYTCSRFLRTCFAEKQLVEPLTKAGSIRDRHNGADGIFFSFFEKLAGNSQGFTQKWGRSS